MKNFTLSLVLGISALSPLLAQDLTEFERIYFQDPESIELDDAAVHAKNGVSQADHSKFALTIENNSSDFLYYVPEESTFKFPFGEFHPDNKPYYIDPDSKKTKTVLAKGGDQFRQTNFEYELSGLYRVPVDGEVLEAPDFQLPASKNSFTVGDFEVNLRGYDASTREAKAQFEVTYKGDQLGIVSPANLSVRANHKKTGDEVVYANDYKKPKTELLEKGDKMKLWAVFHIDGRIVDMQFAVMNIVWNDTFSETSREPINGGTIAFEWDEALTKEKK